MLCQQCINQALIKIQAALIHRPCALRQDTRPGERETVGIEVQRCHQSDVLCHAVVVVGSDIACLSLMSSTSYTSKGIPDGWPSTILQRCTLNLIGRGSGAPEEIGGKNRHA